MEIMLLGLVILICSAILHEIMHGWTASKLGDPTARLLGRLTLNPLPHIDPIMSILVPLLLVISGSPIIFGAAKPVPVNPMNLRDGRKDMALVALAGPATNLVIALISALFFHLTSQPIFQTNLSLLTPVFFLITLYNLMLGFINLIPIPPLDGSKVFSVLLPDELARAYMSIERFGFILVFMLLAFPFGPFSLSGFLSFLIFRSMELLGL